MSPGGARVVVLGGGNGLSCLLSGLKPYVPSGAGAPGRIGRLTAVVTVTDNGGSSGRLREEFRILPPGDIRNCMIALAEDQALLTRLFQYRFPGDGNLSGHSFGNLFLAALTGVTGDFCRAVQLSSEVLAIKGDIFPSTATDVQLVAEFDDGREVRGETEIASSSGRVRRLRLDPEDCRPLPEALTALAEADLVVIGPGSLFTSIIPPLLVPGVRDAIVASPARAVYVCNVMTQPGETDGLGAWGHFERLEAHAGSGLVDAVLLNDAVPSSAALARYHAEGQELVEPELERFLARGITVLSRDLLSETDYVRHEPAKLATELLASLDGDGSREDAGGAPS